MAYNATTISPNTDRLDSDCTWINQRLFKSNDLSYFGLIIAVIMSFLERRRNYKKDKCFGRPGILIPINLINGDKYVLSHSAAFGCTVGSIFFGCFYESNMGTEEENKNYSTLLKSLFVYLQLIQLGLQYYPLFVCVEYGRRNLYAPVIGFLYALLLLCSHLFFIVVCDGVLQVQDTDTLSTSENILILLPVIGCLLYLVILFIRNFIIALSTLLHRKYGSMHCLRFIQRTVLLSYNAEEEDSGSEMFSSKRNRLYVRTLLFNEGNSKNGNSTERLDVKEQLLKNMADQRACFQKEITQRASNRIASIFLISAILLYQLIVVCFRISTWVHEHVKRKSYDGWFWFITEEEERHAAIASFYVASAVAGIILIANVVKIYSSHRRHINRLLAGNNTFIPSKCWNMEPSVLLARNMMYPGIQIGHIVWGFVSTFIVTLVVCLLLSFLIIVDVLYDIIEILLPPVVVSLILFLCVTRICRLFLQSDIVLVNGETKTRKILALTNWRAYQNLSFFIFFIYIITGILACLRRFILSTAIGFYYLARLDKCIIIPGLEQFDKSYMSYVAFLRIQVSHSNPIVTTFCELLLRQMKTLDTNCSAQLSTLSIEDGFENQRKESLARKRWFKAVTLLRNPTLIADSKRKLMKTASALDEDIVGHLNIGNSKANVI